MCEIPLFLTKNTADPYIKGKPLKLRHFDGIPAKCFFGNKKDKKKQMTKKVCLITQHEKCKNLFLRESDLFFTGGWEGLEECNS